MAEIQTPPRYYARPIYLPIQNGSDKQQPRKSGNIDFLDAKGQLTLWSVVGSVRISNSSKLLRMSLLLASMKRI